MSAITLSSLLITKFCHDLAGPLGGLQNGIEFLSESESSDAAELLALSSNEASARLQVFRHAYGTFAPQSSANAAEMEQIVHGFLKQTKLAANINSADAGGAAAASINRAAIAYLWRAAGNHL